MRIPGRQQPSDDTDWVTQATKYMTGLVDNLHDAAVVPITTIVRAIVFGTLVLIAGLAAAVLFSAGLFRVIHVYIHNIPGAPDGIWLTYLAAGAIFVIASLFCWTKRKAS
jgi:hypothetical protein